MQTIKVSATKARQNFFELFNLVYSGRDVLVEKDKKYVIKMTPLITADDWEEKRAKMLRAIRETRGILKGKKFENPLRSGWGMRWLGRWDKKNEFGI